MSLRPGGIDWKVEDSSLELGRMKKVGINHSYCTLNFYRKNQVVFYTPDDCVDEQTQWVTRKTGPLDYGD